MLRTLRRLVQSVQMDVRGPDSGNPPEYASVRMLYVQYDTSRGRLTDGFNPRHSNRRHRYHSDTPKVLCGFTGYAAR